MLYRKVRISHLDDKKALYRIMYIPEHISLYSFAQIIMHTFRCEGDHLYEFRKGQTPYVGERSLQEEYGDYLMKKYGILDPGDTYRFIYDYGDHWEFEVRI